MVRNRNYRAWLAAGALICGTAYAAVDLSTSELIKVTGSVEVKKGQDASFKPVPANLKLAGALKRLDGGDKVKTGVESSAELALKNTCVLAVKEGSLFEVPLTLDQAALTKLNAQQGSFLFKVVSGSDFKVQTADIIAGVKGTLFEVEIHDEIDPLLITPGLELGVEGAGGTVVNVFEGDVELTHAVTGKSRRLKAGNRLAAFGRRIMNLDTSLAEGFGQATSFKPLQRLQERFGNLGMRLGSVPSTAGGIGGINTEGVLMPFKRGRAHERMNSLMEGVSAPVLGKLRRVRGMKKAFTGRLNQLNEARQTMQNLKGKEFEPTIDEGRYPIQAEPLVVPENGISEAHLGEGQFLAISPEPGCQAMTLRPERGGLMLQEGVGTIRLKNPIDGVDGMLAVKTQGDHLLHFIQVNSGTLLARLPGEPSTISVTPSQPLAVEFDPAAGTARKIAWPQDPSFNQDVAGYRLAAETDIEAQRAEHDAKVNETRGNALQNIIKKAPKKIRLPKFFK